MKILKSAVQLSLLFSQQLRDSDALLENTDDNDNFHVAKSGGVEKEWIVVLKDRPKAAGIYSADALQNIAYEYAQKTGSADMKVMGTFTNVFSGFAVGGMTEEAAREFARDKRVDFVEQNLKATTTGTKDPKSWGLDRIDERSMPLDKCYAPLANRDGSGVHAYIIDSGIRISHDQFRGRARWGINTVGDGKDRDCDGHGTHVAGTVGAREYGVAKNVNLVAVKVMDCNGDGTTSMILQGIDWVRGDAAGKKATANISLGFGFRVTSVNLAVKNLVESGVPTAVAAGNDNKDACNESPASESTAITVGATGPSVCDWDDLFSCVSGNTGIITKSNKGSRVTQVRDLKVGDAVAGVDANMKPATCKVEAIGSFGEGVVYGNYTSDHFVLNPTSKRVEQHGRIGKEETVDKYDLISDCPLVEDESGTRFGPIDSDFCGGNIQDLSWSDYLILHKAILRVVRQSGGFWFHMDSYKDMATLAKFAPPVCKSMLKCMKDEKACNSLEKASRRFVDNALTDSAKAKTLNVFTNIGSFNKKDSVSAVITGGVTVGMTAIKEVDVQEEDEYSTKGGKEDKRACFSNYGSCLDIWAPGTDIKSPYNIGDSWIYKMGGTSMASPHVCGALALHLQNGASPAEATALVKSQATPNKVEDAKSGSPNLLLYVGGGTACPSGGSCVSGDTGIVTKKKDSEEETVVQVRHLAVGDTVRGYDSNLKPGVCKVEAIGSFETGTVYGNYTADHFVYYPKTNSLQEHGEVGAKKSIDIYDMISDCPLIEDESGKRFGPMDSDFCGEDIKTLSWKSYLLLHKAILNVVRETGTFWFSSSSYKDMATVKKFAPSVCKNMLRCVRNNKRCAQLEKAAQKFINQAMTGSAKAKTLETFTKIGSRCETGSVSSVVTGGKSVDAALIGTSSCEPV